MAAEAVLTLVEMQHLGHVRPWAHTYSQPDKHCLRQISTNPMSVPRSSCKLQQVHASASHTGRFADINIQSSWRSRQPSSWNSSVSTVRAETSIRSRWRNGGRDSDSPIVHDAVSDSSSPSAEGRFSSLFNNNKQNPATYNTASSSTNGGSSYIPASSSSIIQSSTAADHAAPWVLIALLPTMVWCVTW